MWNANLVLAALLLALFVLAPAAGAEATVVEAAGEIRTADIMDRANPPPFAPGRVTLEFAGEGTAPEGAFEPSFATAEMAGAKLAVVLAKSTEDAAAPDLLFVDLDGDGAFGESERWTLQVQSRELQDGQSFHQAVQTGLAASAKGRTWPFVFAYGSRPGMPLTAQLIGLWYLQADVKVGEKTYAFYAHDDDMDGSFAGPKDLWFIEVPGTRDRPMSAYGASGPGEGRFLDGHRLEARVAEDGSVRVSYETREGPLPQDLAAQRTRVEHVWKERFDKDVEEFNASRGVDTTRPKTATPIQWKFVTFDEGLALAKAAGKPLFVDVLAFWCVWCYRMDYHTYPDAEVAELLNTKFIPLKIIQEQDPADDYSRLMGLLGARGIPAMGIFTPEGELVKFIGGWRKPVEFVRDLQDGLDEFEGAAEEEPGDDTEVEEGG